jgi:hypothetical protein
LNVEEHYCFLFSGEITADNAAHFFLAIQDASTFALIKWRKMLVVNSN